MAKRVSNHNAIPLISDRTEFNGHNFKGVWTNNHFMVTGSLPNAFYEHFKDSDYVVFSYATPIAWYKQSKWFIPALKYSTTTSKHQSFVQRALSTQDEVTVLAYDSQELKQGNYKVVEYPFDLTIYKKVRL